VNWFTAVLAMARYKGIVNKTNGPEKRKA